LKKVENPDPQMRLGFFIIRIERTARKKERRMMEREMWK
jgi:hypothetical protein